MDIRAISLIKKCPSDIKISISNMSELNIMDRREAISYIEQFEHDYDAKLYVNVVSVIDGFLYIRLFYRVNSEW